jgi:hypothetical protein
VYVDSGSTDGSRETAARLGAHVVSLDTDAAFSAARARNTGFERLLAVRGDVRFVQFVDGDCEVVAGWLERGRAALVADDGLAVVAGRRRERFPESSIYNRLCDLEWDTPVGPAKACGGDALVRAAALSAVGGYDPSVIAGEEPELCVRLRGAGWRIERLDAEMTLHDAAMTRFGQWWRRTLRAGHAYAEGAHRHGRPPERHWVRESRSIWFWGCALPVIGAALAWPTRGWSLLVLAAYVVLGMRVALHCRRRKFGLGDAAVYALFTVLGKFPQACGQIAYHVRRLAGARPRIIEYKGARP